MAFFACDALETITTLREEPPVTSENAFTEEHYETVTVVVASKEIKEAYQARRSPLPCSSHRRSRLLSCMVL